MNNILEVLDKFYISIGQIRQEVSKIITEHQTKVDKLEDGKMTLASQRAALDQREAEVKKIENVITFEKEVKVSMKKYQEDQSKLQKDQDAFENYRREEASKLKIREDNAYEGEKALKRDYEDLKKSREILKNEQETYKEKLTRGLVDLANKK